MQSDFAWSGIGARDGDTDNTQLQRPAMQELFNMFGSIGPKTMQMQTSKLCADTTIGPAADPVYMISTGRHINSTQLAKKTETISRRFPGAEHELLDLYLGTQAYGIVA